MLVGRTGTSRKATRIPSPAQPSRRSRTKGARSARTGGPRDREVGGVGQDLAEVAGVFARVRLVEDDPVGVAPFAFFDVRQADLFDLEMRSELVARPGEGRLLLDPRPLELFFARSAP